MRSQNSDVSRCFASRTKLCFVLGEVEIRHDGVFQQAASSRPLHWLECRTVTGTAATVPSAASRFFRLLFRIRQPTRLVLARDPPGMSCRNSLLDTIRRKQYLYRIANLRK